MQGSAVKTSLAKTIVESDLSDGPVAEDARSSNKDRRRIPRFNLAGKLGRRVTESRQWLANRLDSSSIYTTMQEELASGIDGTFESVIAARQIRAMTAIAGPSDVQDIIQRYTIENAAMAGSLRLMPSPWGMVGFVPEIAAVMRKQIAMVYDIGVAHGKEAQITSELLAGILMAALGNGVTSLLVMGGGKVLVRRASPRVFQQVVALLAGRVTQQALKSAISTWLPVAGALFMAWLSGYMTRKIGALADEVFSKEIDISDLDMTDADLPTEASAGANMHEPA